MSYLNPANVVISLVGLIISVLNVKRMHILASGVVAVFDEDLPVAGMLEDFCKLKRNKEKLFLSEIC